MQKKKTMMKNTAKILKKVAFHPQPPSLWEIVSYGNSELSSCLSLPAEENLI